jgi:glyoxylase-like metal-dependent hydrolase (beta-lactamase superfamily II)
VDAGCGRSLARLIQNIQTCGVKPEAIEYLLITHCHYDHAGGARALKDRLGCQIVAHHLDARFLEQGDDRVTAARWYGCSIEPVQIDRKLAAAREQIHLGAGGRTIEAIHTPGHSPGSVVYLTESDGLRVLFGQDVHGPLDPTLLSNRQDYLRSLHLLISLQADVLCEGHHGIFEGKEEVEDFIRSFLR